MHRKITLALLAILLLSLSLGSAFAAPSVDAIPVLVNISPKSIVITPEEQDWNWLTVHTDIAYSSVDTSSITLGDVPVAWTNYDNQGNLVAKFKIESFIDRSVQESRAVTLVLEGKTKDDVTFSGSGSVSFIVLNCKRQVEASFPVGIGVIGRSTLFSRLCSD